MRALITTIFQLLGQKLQVICDKILIYGYVRPWDQEFLVERPRIDASRIAWGLRATPVGYAHVHPQTKDSSQA